MKTSSLPRASKSGALIVGTSNCLMRTAVSELLMREVFLDKVLQVEDAEQALTALARERFALTIVFISFPITAFLPKLARLHEASNKMLLVFDMEGKFGAHHFFNYSIDGIISTTSTYQEFKETIVTVCSKNQKYVSPSLLSSIRLLQKQASPFAHLSKKEMDVAFLIMSGKRNAGIAQELNISHKTVSTYKTRIFKKLNIESDTQLVMYAYKHEAGLAMP